MVNRLMKYWNILLLTMVLCNMAGLVYAQTSYTWNGATDTDFATSTNWTPNGVPGSGDNITIVTGSNTCKLDGNRTVNNLTMTSGTLDLETYTITVGNNSTLNAGTVEDGEFTMSSGTAKFAGTDMDCKVDVTANITQVYDTHFKDSVALDETDAGGYYMRGCIFDEYVEITNSSTGWVRTGNNQPDTFRLKAVFNIEAAGYILLCHGATTNHFEDDVVLNNNSGNTGRGFSIGGNTNAVVDFLGDIEMNVTTGSGPIKFNIGTITHHGQLTIGGQGYHSGLLTLKGYAQDTAIAVDLTGMSNSATLDLGPDLTLEGDLSCAALATKIYTGCTFNGDVSIPDLRTWNGATFGGKADLTVTTGNVYTGGNIFYDSLTVSQTGTGYLYTGDNAADTAYAPSTFNLEAAGYILVGLGAHSNVFSGDVTLNNHSGNSGRYISLGANVSVSNTFNGDIEMNVDSTSGNIRFWLGNTHNGILSIGDEGYHNGTLTIRNYEQTTGGTMDLTGFTNGAEIDVLTGTDITADLIYSDESGGGTITLDEATFRGDVTVESGSLPVTDCEFHGTTILEKSGGTNNLNGGNKFLGDATIANSSATNYVYWGHSEPDTFLYDLTLSNTATSQSLIMAYSTASVFEGDIVLEGDTGNVIQFGGTVAGRKAVLAGENFQTISVENEIDPRIYRLEVNKDESHVELRSPVDIYTELTFVNGLIRSDGDGEVEFLDGCNVIGASDTGHVEGAMVKTGDDPFEFPSGYAGMYRPISMSAPGTTSDCYRVTHHRRNPARLLGDSLVMSLNYLTSLEFYDVSQINGTSDVTWTIGWNEDDNYTGFSTSELRILGWDGIKWSDLGAGTVTGNTTAGTLATSSAMDLGTYTHLALGATNGAMHSELSEAAIHMVETDTDSGGYGKILLVDPPGEQPVTLSWGDTLYPDVPDLDSLYASSLLDTIFSVSADSLFRTALYTDSVQQGILGYVREDRPADIYSLKLKDFDSDSVTQLISIGHPLSELELDSLTSNEATYVKEAIHGWANGYLITENFLDSLEDGGMMFEVTDVVNEMAIGFKIFNDAVSDSSSDMQYAVLLDGGVVSLKYVDTIYEGVDTVVVGDLLAMERVTEGADLKFKYSRNDTVVYSETVNGQKTMVGKVAMKESGATLGKGLGVGGFSVLMAKKKNSVSCYSPYSGQLTFGLPDLDPSTLSFTYHGNPYSPQSTSLLSSNGAYTHVVLNDLGPGTYGVSGQGFDTYGWPTYYSSTARIGTSVEWEELSSATVSNNDIEKSTTTEGWDSYGFSANELSASNEGWIQFSIDASEDELAQTIGFVDGESYNQWQNLKYGIIAVKWPIQGPSMNGYLYGVIINGLLVMVDYAEGNSVFVIEKQLDGGSPYVVFRKNESPVYTHQASGFPEKLHVWANMCFQGNRFRNVSASFLCPDGIYYAASCEDTDDHNWISQKTYDGNGTLTSEGISYVDQLGRPVQEQQRVLTDSDILARQHIFDAFGRAAITTRSAPVGYSASFSYEDDFAKNPNEEPYSYLDFDVPNYTGSSSVLTDGEVDRPKALLTTESGSLGHYYSTNSAEKHVAIADQPYGRVEFSADPSGTVQRTAQAGKELHMGSGHEAKTFSMRTDGSELDSIYGVDKSYRVIKDASDNLDSDPISITGGKMNISKVVTKDADGSETITYRSGALAIASCRSGLTSSCLTQATTVSLAHNSNRSADIHLPEATRGTLFLPWPTYLSGGWQTMDTDDISYTITDIDRKYQLVEGTDYTVNSNRRVVFAGVYATYSGSYFLRIRFDYSTVMQNLINAGLAAANPTEIMFKLDYSHWSLNYYDLAGKLRKSVTRKGFDCAVATGANTMRSTYDYSPLGQLIGEKLTDEGKKEFLYDTEGKLRFTQNAQQSADGKYSYVHYDRFGRPYESGEYAIPGSGGVYFQNHYEDYTICQGCSTTLDILDNTDGLGDTDCDYVTETHYYELETADAIPTSYTSDNSDPFEQEYLLGRVSRTSNENTTTWYSYDQQGRTAFTLQQLDTDFSSDMDDRIKTTEYEYDFTKGFLDKVKYQRFESAEYAIHDFDYDSDNRLSEVKYTAPTKSAKTVAKYQYYPTGELRRIELDEEQGLDYLYTINGWLKGMNDPRMDTDDDPGGDGGTGSSFGQDYFGYAIDYFVDDYEGADNDYDDLNSASGNEFFSGLISAVRYRTNENEARYIDYGGEDIEMLTASTEDHFMTRYTYDDHYQLATSVFGTYEAGSPFSFSSTDHFKEFGPSTTGNEIGYDDNGNITHLYRNGYDDGGDIEMDELVYDVSTTSNLLNSVDDDGAGTGDYGDFTATDATITYNNIGQMTSSPDEDVDDVDYHVNGKAEKVTLDSPANDYIEYFYDDRGRRYKTVYNDYSDASLNKTVWHVGGLSGKPLAIYEQADANADVLLQDMPMYGGGNRIGVYNDQSEVYQFEITDHTGSVRAVFEDDGTNPNPVSLESWGDYYAFGGSQPGRTHNMAAYRYGYQGQEKAEGQDWDMFDLRMYNPHLGRWTTPDPYRQVSSPFNGMGNNPIMNVDPDGGRFYGWKQWRAAQAAKASADRAMLSAMHEAQHAAFLTRNATSTVYATGSQVAPKAVGTINQYGNATISSEIYGDGELSDAAINQLEDLGLIDSETAAAMRKHGGAVKEGSLMVQTGHIERYGFDGQVYKYANEPIYETVPIEDTEWSLPGEIDASLQMTGGVLELALAGVFEVGSGGMATPVAAVMAVDGASRVGLNYFRLAAYLSDADEIGNSAPTNLLGYFGKGTDLAAGNDVNDIGPGQVVGTIINEAVMFPINRSLGGTTTLGLLNARTSTQALSSVGASGVNIYGFVSSVLPQSHMTSNPYSNLQPYAIQAP